MCYIVAGNGFVPKNLSPKSRESANLLVKDFLGGAGAREGGALCTFSEPGPLQSYAILDFHQFTVLGATEIS